MEILDKCFFYDLSEIIRFKKYNVFDLGLNQTFQNEEDGFDTQNNSFKVSFPHKSTLNHFAHISLESGHNYEYQDFLLSKLHNMVKLLDVNTSGLRRAQSIRHLVIIFDISSSWHETIYKHGTGKNVICIEGTTTVLRIPLLQMLDSMEYQDNTTFLKVLQFFRLYLSSPSSIADFFRDVLKLDMTEFNLTAVIIDNLSFLNIYNEPQVIELTRKSKLNSMQKSSEKTQLEHAQLMEFMDYLNYLHQTLGTLIVTTSFNI